MKRFAKQLVLFLLVFSALFAFSCKKKPNENDPANGSSDGDQTVEGLLFHVQEDSTVLVEMSNDAKAAFTGETLVIPGSSTDGQIVTEIGSFGFWRLTTLKTVVMPYNIEKINASAFEGCTSLTSVTMPANVERISLSAFEGCTSLTTITLPVSLFIIGADAFKDCTALTEVTYEGTIEQWDAFEPYRRSNWIDVGKTITIHCTDGDTTATGAQPE